MYILQGDLVVSTPPYAGVLLLEQFSSDKGWLYGMLETSLRGSQGKAALLKYENSEDGVKAWYQLLKTCDHGGNKEARAQVLKGVISKDYHK